VEYHEQSLKNLGVAMQRTKRLCAIIVDTIGREIMINRPYSLDEVRSATAVHGQQRRRLCNFGSLLMFAMRR